MELTFTEATYQGKKVTLNKPFRTPSESKKFAVYTTHPVSGNVIKVRFGDSNMEIRRDDPEARKSFRARHKCDTKSFASDRHTAGYWSCRMWQKGKSVSQITKEKMENELKSELEKLEKTIEAIDKNKNPIEENPTNLKAVKPVKLDEPNVPKDKKNKDKLVDDGAYVKKIKQEFVENCALFNSLCEKKIYVQDPFDAPPGVNVQIGPDGGYYYEFETGQSSGNTPKEDKKKPLGKKKVDLGKAK